MRVGKCNVSGTEEPSPRSVYVILRTMLWDTPLGALAVRVTLPAKPVIVTKPLLSTVARAVLFTDHVTALVSALSLTIKVN